MTRAEMLTLLKRLALSTERTGMVVNQIEVSPVLKRAIQELRKKP